MRVFNYVILLLTIIIGITFASLNAESVLVHYYVGNSYAPLSFLLVTALGIGCFLGFSVGFLMYCRTKRENFRLMHRVKVAEKEVANMRMMPLKENDDL